MSDTLATVVTEEDKFDATSLHGIPKNPEEEAKLVKEEKDLLLANYLLRKKNEAERNVKLLQTYCKRLYGSEQLTFEEQVIIDHLFLQVKDSIEKIDFDPRQFWMDANASVWASRISYENTFNIAEVLQRLDTDKLTKSNIGKLYSIFVGVYGHALVILAKYPDVTFHGNLHDVYAPNASREETIEIFQTLIDKVCKNFYTLVALKGNAEAELKELNSFL